MALLPERVRAVIESGPLAHLVTLNADGSPQVSVVWIGVEGDEIVSGHLYRHRKVRNVERDPTVALSFEAPGVNEIGLQSYVVVYGSARITEGGAPELLQRLARVYVRPDAVFPPMADPPPGFVTRITVDRITGIGHVVDDL
jgi:PPOX class probable F420-dependent enzyme